MRKVLLVFSAFSFLFIFSSCNKNEGNEPALNDCKIARVESKSASESNRVKQTFGFNHTGQYASSVDNSIGTTYFLTYSDNKISAITPSFHFVSPFSTPRDFYFNTQGFVDSITVELPDQKQSSDLEYNSASQLIKITQTAYEPGTRIIKLRRVEKYIYNLNNNIEKIIATSYHPNQDSTTWHTLYEYDDNPNPFYAFRYFLTGAKFWSVNNITKITNRYYHNGLYSGQQHIGAYKYIYRKNGLPELVTFLKPDGTSAEEEYFYRCD